MTSKDILRWMSIPVAFIIAGALLLILHTHGHLIELILLRYLLVWVPFILLVVFFPRHESSRPITKTVLSAAILVFLSIF